MKKQELETMFEQYCKVFNLTIGGPSYREGGENGKYISPKPGTYNLIPADIRLGRKFTIAKYGENGSMAICYDYVTDERLYGVMQGLILGKQGAFLNSTNC